MFKLVDVLKLLPVIGPIAAAAPEFEAIFDQIVATFDSDADQATLKEARKDLIADNDEGFARLDAKLAEAAKR